MPEFPAIMPEVHPHMAHRTSLKVPFLFHLGIEKARLLHGSGSKVDFGFTFSYRILFHGVHLLIVCKHTTYHTAARISTAFPSPPHIKSLTDCRFELNLCLNATSIGAVRWAHVILENLAAWNGPHGF